MASSHGWGDEGGGSKVVEVGEVDVGGTGSGEAGGVSRRGGVEGRNRGGEEGACCWRLNFVGVGQSYVRRSGVGE